MYFKIHESYRDVIAICDSELIGKTFEEGKLSLEIKESFFKGEKISEEKLIRLMGNMSKEDATFNIVGEKSVNVAIKSGIISNDNVIKVQGIPFVLILA